MLAQLALLSEVTKMWPAAGRVPPEHAALQSSNCVLPGWLAKMESEEYQSDRAFYLEAFNGDGRFTYDRIGRGTTVIENCTLSIIGGIQPSRLAPLVRGAVSGTANDGLIQRFQLAVWPDPRGSWEWVDRAPDLAAKATYENAFRRLHDLRL